jgi:hypothetical protein
MDYCTCNDKCPLYDLYYYLHCLRDEKVATVRYIAHVDTVSLYLGLKLQMAIVSRGGEATAQSSLTTVSLNLIGHSDASLLSSFTIHTYRRCSAESKYDGQVSEPILAGAGL